MRGGGRCPSSLLSVSARIFVWHQVWIWSREKFVNRKNLIDEMYLKYLDGEALSVDKLKDPFWDPIDDVFLGRLVTP